MTVEKLWPRRGGLSASAAVDGARTRPRTHSIQFWLRWLVLACVLPAWAVTTWLIVTSGLQTRDARVHSTIDTARALMQTVDRELASSVAGLQALATSPFLASRDFANFHRQASEALTNFDGINIVVIDRTGQHVIDTTMPFGAPLPRRESARSIVEAFQTARPGVSDLFVGTLDSQPKVGIVVPIIDNGAVNYVLGLAVSPERLGEILYGAKLPDNWISGIVDSTGTIVARTRNPSRFIGKKVAPELLRAIAKAPEGIIEGETLDGIPVAVAFSRSTVSGWAVGIAIPRAELMAPLYQSLRLTISAAAGLFLGALLIAWLISSRITQSIGALKEPALSLAADTPVLAPRLAIREVHEIGGALVEASQLLKERRIAREKIEEAERHMAVTRALVKVNDAGVRLWQAKTLQEGLDEVLSAVIDLLGTDMGTVQLLDSGGKLLRMVSHRGLNQEFLDHFREFPAEQDSAFGSALRSGDIAVIEDTDLDLSSTQFVSIRRVAGYRALVAAPLINSRGTLVGMVSAYFRAPHRPSDSEMQWLEHYRRRASDFIQRLADQDALRESEERLRLAVTASRMGMFDWDMRTGASSWSNEWYRMLGYEAGEVEPSQAAWMARIHPEDRKKAIASHERTTLRPKEITSDYRIIRNDGEVRWIRTHGRFLFEAGKPVRLIGLKQDVTEAHEQLETQRVLVAELQHRTRNLMAVVQSIARQTLDNVESLADFEDRFNHRLEALSRVQSLLSRADNEPISVRALVVMELEALGPDICGERITLAGPEVPLRKSSVEMLSLALHELLTNAIKYGALASPTARLSVTWRVDGARPNQRLVLEWIERGVESLLRPTDPTRRGYGRTLIDEALPYSLSAETKFELRADGLNCLISFPLATNGADGAL